MDSLFFEYRKHFLTRIQQSESTAARIEDSIPQNDEPSVETPDTSVCVRIRPLTSQEEESKHIKGVVRHDKNVVNLYEMRRRINGKPDLNSSSFTLDEVYGCDSNTQDIYSSRVQELVQWGLAGGTSMLLAYGQTGSGKTFTVTGLETLWVDEMIEAQVSGKKEIQVCIFEVCGSKVLDLLNERKPLAVLEDAFGTIQLKGIFELSPKSCKEFLELIRTAKELRTTASTTKNDESSRSHSICRMRIVDLENEIADEGTIMLVDLAGSEASSDTTHHSKERMVETRENNKSLSILKECITKRAQWSISKSEGKTKHIHIPYRTNKLTQILKSVFDVNNTQPCKTIVIACIAPSILDAAHSKNTLRYAETLRVPIPKAKSIVFDERIPTTWSNEDIQSWITKTSGKPLWNKLSIQQKSQCPVPWQPINPKLLAPRENGTQLCRLDEDKFIRRAILSKGVEYQQAKLLHNKLWTLHIDSRALLNRTADTVENVQSPQPKTNGSPKKIILPGMFFEIAKTGASNREYVMAMGEVKDENGRWTCADVLLAQNSRYRGAYELLVTDQAVFETRALRDETQLVYDSGTRYYYVKGDPVGVMKRLS